MSYNLHSTKNIRSGITMTEHTNTILNLIKTSNDPVRAIDIFAEIIDRLTLLAASEERTLEEQVSASVQAISQMP